MGISNKETNNNMNDIFVDASKKELDNLAEMFYTSDTITMKENMKGTRNG